MENNDLKHVGVLGMKWGRRRASSAAKATARDAASLRAHGYKKEAEAVQKVSDAQRKKAEEYDRKIKEVQGKKLSPESAGKLISANSPLRGRMKPILGKENRAKIKDATDRALGKSIGLEKISQLKNKELTVTMRRNQYLSTVALAVIGSITLGKMLAEM